MTRRMIAQRIGPVLLGCVLVAFGFWELTQPTQWSGYVPPFVAAVLPAVPLVLVHGWFLLVLGVAVVIDFMPAVTSWLAAAVMIEVVLGLLVTSGVSITLVRDSGILGLALTLALNRPRALPQPAAGRGHGGQRSKAATGGRR